MTYALTHCRERLILFVFLFINQLTTVVCPLFFPDHGIQVDPKVGEDGGNGDRAHMLQRQRGMLRSTRKNGQKRNVSAVFGRLVIGNNATAENGKRRATA